MRGRQIFFAPLRFQPGRRIKPVPPGGFDPGVERTVGWLTREKHIRQCIPFPRLMDKVYI